VKDHHGCAVQAAINTLSGKWKVLIVWHLSRSPLRFAAIRRKLKNISEKVLTDQLRQLGKKLVPIMETLCDWGSQHFHIKRSFPKDKGSGQLLLGNLPRQIPQSGETTTG